MATAALSNDDFSTNIDNNNLELFSLIWLDANSNVAETRNTEQKLRSIINYLKRFQNVAQCQEYIEQRSQKDRLLVIVSGQMGREIVPSVHKLRQVISIYVYCKDKERNEQWACKFKKIRGVAVELGELLSQIQADHKIQKKVEEPLSINIFTTSASPGKTTTGVNGEFLFSQVLIDCLLRLKSTERDQNELIELCRNQYKDNAVELKNIKEFKDDYSSKRALWWYTTESFFYKTLNAALRNQDIHTIFLFRSFIFDIYQQLKKNQSKKLLRVYRSQTMTKDELNTLKENVNQRISVNSFISGSADYGKALSFLGISDASDDLKQVIFEIEADPKVVTTKPFADISAHSYYRDEAEVLFMIGSIFRLKSFDRIDNQVWRIRMTLCSDDEHDLKQVLTVMTEQLGNGETNLQTLGKLLWEMGKLDLAQTYFVRSLKELAPNDPSRSNLLEELAKLASQKGNYDKSVQWRQKAIEAKTKHQTNNSTGEITSSLYLKTNTDSKQNRRTIAGGNGQGDELNQLSRPHGICIDEKNQCIYISDYENHRIVQWKYRANMGEVIAGGNGKGKQMNQLNSPTDVIVDRNTDSLIICDYRNRRVVQWPRHRGTKGQIIISEIDCCGLAMDKNGDLYVSDNKKNEVRRWKIGQTSGTIVAGGNGKGNQFNQLNWPTNVFVDEDQSVYVSDLTNHRVMKWMKGAKTGIVVAGGQGDGDSLKQLSHPQGVAVDHLGNVYVSDSDNHRIMCWSKGSKEGRVIVGGNGQGEEPNQFSSPTGLLLDQHRYLYVVDHENHRVQKFVLT